MLAIAYIAKKSRKSCLHKIFLCYIYEIILLKYAGLL